MRGPISGSAYANKGVVSYCCCGCSLRTGSLIIGWLHLISAVLNIINMIVGRTNGVLYVQIIGILISLYLGLLIVIGTYKLKANLFWAAVYVTIIITVWYLIVSIIFFTQHLWAFGGGFIVGAILNIYFIVVLRSYGYEIDADRGAAINPA